MELILAKPLLRGTKLKHKHSEFCDEFRYKNLSIFYFYCGLIGHNEKSYDKRCLDMAQNCVLHSQYGYWLKAGYRKSEGVGNKGNTGGRDMRIQEIKRKKN